ncbi:MAG: carboxypeptidase-like regulatory domain-containing protein, partial [Chloroflexota bacterium]|nr:carboxypeptidase-like regulatory domain-containing protein [Chloroflexota bacterium]
MLVGHVSDERYVAVADALVEFEQDGQFVTCVRTTASGAIHAAIEPGRYALTTVRDGFGSKRSVVDVDPTRPAQIRLLRDGLLGYCWPKWVRTGERSEFRVHAVEPYKLCLWRYGWEKEHIRGLGWFDEHGPRAVMQITPDGDYTQTGVRWNSIGYGSPHLTQFVTGPERTGLYYLHAETDSGRFFAFPWVVAPAQPSAPIAVVMATNTWNAYNNFGGRSNYINSSGLPERPAVNARQDLTRYARASAFNEWGPRDEEYPPLAFERPEPNNTVGPDDIVTGGIAGRQQCHLAPAEWRTLGWLEREGFAHDVYSDAQLHDGTLDLDAYRVLVISVHPEYWSREMYLRVKAWVHERGGRLMYLGGNGLNCEVEFVEDGNALHFRNHQPSEGGEFRYFNQELGREVDSRMDRALESEARLLGVAMT